MATGAQARVILAGVLRIRRAVHSDLPSIFAIYDEEVLHGTATFDTVPYTPEQREAWLKAHQSEHHPALVADEGKVLAFGTLSPWTDRPGCQHIAEVAVFVDRHCNRDGLGQRLFQELIVHARTVGLGVLISGVCPENQPAHELDTAFGFRYVGTLQRVGKKFGRYLDLELFELQLDPPR
jgi:L-amino acid N-acyltransferase